MPGKIFKLIAASAVVFVGAPLHAQAPATGFKRALLLAVAEHAGEHLGQEIAYARMNGIVPPWSK